MLLLITTLSLTFSSCGGNDDEPGNKDNPHTSAVSVKYVKKANCPYADMRLYAVYDGEIYFSNSVTFAKYSPNSNTWTTLQPLNISSNFLFVYKNRLFSAGGSTLEIYDKSNDSWSDATNFLGALPHEGHSNSTWSFAVVDGKLYMRGYYNTQHRVYNNATKLWETVSIVPPGNNPNIFNFKGCGYYISDSAVYEYNTYNNTIFEKINVSAKYSYVCAYNSSTMLAMSNSKRFYSSLILCLYNPENNDFKKFEFVNDNTIPIDGVEYCDIPIISDKIVNFNNRFFIGPDNSQFYEIELKLKR